MSTQALLDAIVAAPDDDAPRLVWADAIGGERGELVVIQCDLARGQLSPAEAAARRRRERELLAKHNAAWSGIWRFVRDVAFRRGLVEAAMIDAGSFRERGREIFEAAPLLRSVTLTELTTLPVSKPSPLEQVLASPHLPRLTALDLVGVGTERGPRFVGAGDEAAVVFARSGVLRRLRGFGITFANVGARGAHALVASGDLENLERLWLRGHLLGDDAALAILRAAPRLASLDLVGQVNIGSIAGALPALRELRFGNADTRVLASLAASRVASSLEEVVIENGRIADAGAFSAFARLRSLDLKHAMVTAAGVRTFAKAELPALRSLRLGTQIVADDILRIARAFGPQLETLDVRGANLSERIESELAAVVAGEVVISMKAFAPTRML